MTPPPRVRPRDDRLRGSPRARRSWLRRRGAGAVGALLLVAMGCRDPAPEGITVSIRSLTVREAMAELGRVTGRPYAIDASAEPVADCARFSLSVTEPTSVDAVVALFARTVRSSRFFVTPDENAIVLSFSGGPAPTGCAESPHDPTAAPESDELAEVWARAPIPAELVDDFRIVSDVETEMTRAAREAVLADPTDAMSLRVVPWTDDGTPIGVTLYAVRRSAVATAIGLANGDRLIDVNGYSVAGPTDALEAELRTADRFEIHLRRVRRIPLTLIVTIVDALSPPETPASPAP